MSQKIQIVNIEHNISLKPYNTFAVHANAKQFCEVTTENQLVELFKAGAFQDTFFVLGGGSNVLFTQDYTGTIIKITNKGMQHFIEGNYAYVTAAGGEVWNDFVWYCIDHNFPGMENMALIPGTVGASPIQNIGAYGAELMNYFYTCRAFDTHTGQFTTFTNSECAFTYRDSIFKNIYKNRFIITAVTYKLHLHAKRNTSYGAIEAELTKRNIVQPTISDIAKVVSAIRIEKLPDPSMVGNAGSFFKNPIITHEQFDSLYKEHPNVVFYAMESGHKKLAAGWLIEQCGWKGKQVGQVAVWKNQALVLTNKGDALGIEIYAVSTNIIDDVYKKFNIKLEREVNIL